MSNTVARLTLPILIGDAQIGTVEVDTMIDFDETSRTVKVQPVEIDGHLAAVFRRQAAVLEHSGLGANQSLEWPTTPGSAVLADRHNGVGPQVLMLQDSVGGPAWWGASGDIGARPVSGWTWGETDRYTLLQVLYVAP